jgi:hypothetical protein
MLRTRFCERFGVAAPIVVAPMGPDLTYLQHQVTGLHGSGPYRRQVFLHHIGAVTFSFGSETNESLRTARSRLFSETSYSNSTFGAANGLPSYHPFEPHQEV